CALERRRPAWPSDAPAGPPRSGPGRSRGQTGWLAVENMLGQREHVRGNGEVGQVAEVILGLAHLIGVAQRGAEKPLVVWLKCDHSLALREHEPPERHHPLAAHGFANHRKGLLPDRRAGHDIIRAIEEALVDRGVRHKSVDLDGVGALDLDRFELRILNDEVLALGHLVAAAFVLGGDRLAGFFIDELLAQAIAGGLVDLPEGDALGTRAGRMERNRTADQSQFEIAFPVGTHNQLLWFSVYACEAVCRGKDAVFISAAFIPRAGCEPSRPSRALAFLLRRAGAPFPRARAKNRGPLQAVPVMARAMADRLG